MFNETGKHHDLIHISSYFTITVTLFNNTYHGCNIEVHHFLYNLILFSNHNDNDNLKHNNIHNHNNRDNYNHNLS